MAILGELELRIMENLWVQGNPMSVRDVHENLLNERSLAYTTVMTVLDRLAKKGLVHRERDGRAWLYRSGVGRVELVVDDMQEALAEAGDERVASLRAFVENLPEADRAVLREALG